MKTVRWTVFIGGTLAGGSPNKKPGDEVAGSRRGVGNRATVPHSRAKRGNKPLPTGGGVGEGEFRSGG